MKLIIIFFLLTLVSCNDEQVHIYKTVKANPDSEYCFNIYRPEELTGRYCTYYKGDKKWFSSPSYSPLSSLISP